MPGVLATQGNSIAEHTKFQWVATNRRTGQFNFGTLDEAQHHQSLNHWIVVVDTRDHVFAAWFEGRQGHIQVCCSIRSANDNHSHPWEQYVRVLMALGTRGKAWVIRFISIRFGH